MNGLPYSKNAKLSKSCMYNKNSSGNKEILTMQRHLSSLSKHLCRPVLLAALLSCLTSGLSLAAEHKLSAIVDVRATHSGTNDSYVSAGLGKFRYDQGARLSLAQLGLSSTLEWDDNWSSHIVVNGYLDGLDNNLGLTEAYLSYKPAPWDNGLRFEGKAGLMYPQISLENIATAWASPYTLSYSTMNAWLGEEVRHLGVRMSLSSLGKYRQSPHDFSFTTEVFGYNDTTGAMLSWHGWTTSSRQTLQQENLPISDIPAMRAGGMLHAQAKASDPFLELDDRVGVHFLTQWRWQSKGSMQLGYYDNSADTRVVKQGQYAWRTRFAHVGIKWRLPYGVDMLAQIMSGDSLMMSPSGINVVDNDFYSSYLLVSKKINAHRLSLRVEDFSVTDVDLTPGDNNNESGQALTLSYQYQLSRPWFLQLEYNLIDSQRMARSYQGLDVELLEQQWQLASRYFF
jgi:hypothetical protein